jgi:hypothetical protein
MKIPEQSKLDEIVKKLAEILRIQDWDIETHIVSGYEMSKHTEDDDSTVEGLSVRNVRLNHADIYMNHEGEFGWYKTLVHELIHVQTTDLIYTAESYLDKKATYLSDKYESMVDKQAAIFCKLYPSTNFIAEV